MNFLLELKKTGKCQKLLRNLNSLMIKKTGAVSVFWENVHLAAKALKEDTNCPNEIIASGLRAVAAEWD